MPTTKENYLLLRAFTSKMYTSLIIFVNNNLSKEAKQKHRL